MVTAILSVCQARVLSPFLKWTLEISESVILTQSCGKSLSAPLKVRRLSRPGIQYVLGPLPHSVSNALFSAGLMKALLILCCFCSEPFKQRSVAKLSPASATKEPHS